MSSNPLTPSSWTTHKKTQPTPCTPLSLTVSLASHRLHHTQLKISNTALVPRKFVVHGTRSQPPSTRCSITLVTPSSPSGAMLTTLSHTRSRALPPPKVRSRSLSLFVTYEHILTSLSSPPTPIPSRCRRITHPPLPSWNITKAVQYNISIIAEAGTWATETATSGVITVSERVT